VRVGRTVALVALVTATHARADEFPAAIAERPLVLPCGTTQLNVSWESRTYVEAMTDGMGNVSEKRIGFFDDVTPDFRLAHTFRNVEVEAFLGERTGVNISIDTFSIPGEVYVGAAFSNVQLDGRYNHSQYAGVINKFRLVPERLAIHAGASVAVGEALGILDGMSVEGGIVTVSAGASVYVQLGWRFAASAGLGTGAPLWQTDGFRAHGHLDASTYFYLGLRRWDVYVGGNLFDITRSDPATFFTLGVKKRWGV
jgi:hypothetical protein